MKKSILSLAVLTAIGLPLMACAPQNPAEPTTTPDATTENEKPFTVKDVRGRELHFEKHAETAICLGAGALRLYSFVGDMNDLKAVEEYEKPKEGGTLRPYQFAYKDIIEAKPVCGKGGPGKPSYDYELLATLAPDVIFTCDKSDNAFLDSITTKTNCPVVAIDYGKNNCFDLSDTNPFTVSLKSIATIMGEEDRFNNLHTYINETVTLLNDRTKDIAAADKKDVYFGGVGKKLAKGLHCSSQNHAMLNAVHAKNILDDKTFTISGNMEVDKEFLTTLNPDLVFIDAGGLADVKTQLKTAGQKETFQNWAALKNGNAHVILPYGDYNTQPECGLLNAMYIGKVCFPDAFKDFNVDRLGTEVFKAFYGVENYNDFLAYNHLNGVVLHSITF